LKIVEEEDVVIDDITAMIIEFNNFVLMTPSSLPDPETVPTKQASEAEISESRSSFSESSVDQDKADRSALNSNADVPIP
jgi:hypothetical protein